MTGYELIYEPARGTRNKMSIMMVTTERSSQVQRALDAGANEYVMKPFTEGGARLFSSASLRVGHAETRVLVGRLDAVRRLFSDSPPSPTSARAAGRGMALAKIVQHSPDVVTLDVESPT